MSQPYQDLIDTIVTATLKGKVRSQAQVYRQLRAEVPPGEGELFERALDAALARVEAPLQSADELVQAKAMRQQRALKTIQTQWQRWQQDTRASSALDQVLATLQTTDPAQRCAALIAALDPNQPQPLTRDQLAQLAQTLTQSSSQTLATPPADPDPTPAVTLAELGMGLQRGLASWQQLEGELVGWMYAQAQGNLGFGNAVAQRGPWPHWQKQVTDPTLVALFADLATGNDLGAGCLAQPLAVTDWVTWAVVLPRLQRGLVHWFDRQPYDPKAGKRLSIAVYLTFAVVWSRLAQTLGQLGQSALADGSFQVVMQGLRQFANQPYFPLYGGLLAALSGESLRSLLDYLDQPLQQSPNTAVKARILTLLGYSQQAFGQPQVARRFHQQALETARDAADHRCEVASLNHLSRTHIDPDDPDAAELEQALAYSQRALVLARQQGDTLGQANALANLGYGQIIQAQTQLPDPERYGALVAYLEQGLTLAIQEGDAPSRALCAHSLGRTHLVLGDTALAIAALNQSLEVAQAMGDRYLVAVNWAALASAYQQQQQAERAVLTGCLAMYLLHQIESPQWRQPAALLSILQGQWGAERFAELLADQRRSVLAVIGVDGYDFLLPLLVRYQESLD